MSMYIHFIVRIQLPSFLPYLVLEVWKMGGCCHWWQATNTWWTAYFCSLQKSKWVLARSAGESLRQVSKKKDGMLARRFILWVFYVYLCQGVWILLGHERRNSSWGIGGLYWWRPHICQLIRTSFRSMGPDEQSRAIQISDGLRYTARGAYCYTTEKTLLSVTMIFTKYLNTRFCVGNLMWWNWTIQDPIRPYKAIVIFDSRYITVVMYYIILYIL